MIQASVILLSRTSLPIANDLNFGVKKKKIRGPVAERHQSINSQISPITKLREIWRLILADL